MKPSTSIHRNQRGGYIPFAAFWQTLAFCLVLFLGHRATIFPMLAAGQAGMTNLHQLQSALVGAASDLWIGSLMALVATIAALVLPLRVFQWLQWGAFLAMALLLAAHHSYVEFYRTPVLVFHMRYLLDPQFLASSQTTVMSPMVGANLGIGALAFYCARRTRDKILNGPPKRRGMIGSTFAVAVAMLFALTAHAFQIHYRVQWFVPGTLQFHTLEKLVIDYARGIEIPAPTEQERQAHSEMLAALKNSPPPNDPADGSTDQDAMSLRLELRRLFAEAVASGSKPVLAIMALETFRPSEIDAYAAEKIEGLGARTQGNTESQMLTPNFNRLAGGGVLFREAFSSGTVTCSGQEALWCGYPSGLYTSLMRVRADLKVDCLPAQIRSPGGLPLWIHNGEGKFDNQVSFWRKHGVDVIVSREDFPAETPGSSWGLSDIALAERSAQEINLARKRNDSAFVAPFILTVTNHIPWELPADAPPWINEVSAPAGQNGRMWRTTAYTDAAIGKFVEAAKAAGFWDQMILVLASDHGNKEPSRHRTRSDGDTRVLGGADSASRLQSHMALLLSGGMVEKALAKDKTRMINAMTVTKTVGQTGVAQLARFIMTGSENPAQPDILAWPAGLPVISDLNESVYFPQIDREIPRERLKSDWTGKLGSQDERALALGVIQLKIQNSATNQNSDP